MERDDRTKMEYTVCKKKKKVKIPKRSLLYIVDS